jgi:hypothetical protein
MIIIAEYPLILSYNQQKRRVLADYQFIISQNQQFLPVLTDYTFHIYHKLLPTNQKEPSKIKF